MKIPHDLQLSLFSSINPLFVFFLCFCKNWLLLNLSVPTLRRNAVHRYYMLLFSLRGCYRNAFISPYVSTLRLPQRPESSLGFVIHALCCQTSPRHGAFNSSGLETDSKLRIADERTERSTKRAEKPRCSCAALPSPVCWRVNLTRLEAAYL